MSKRLGIGAGILAVGVALLGLGWGSFAMGKAIDTATPTIDDIVGVWNVKGSVAQYDLGEGTEVGTRDTGTITITKTGTFNVNVAYDLTSGSWDDPGLCSNGTLITGSSDSDTMGSWSWTEYPQGLPATDSMMGMCSTGR
jgi:hypothetical protein